MKSGEEVLQKRSPTDRNPPSVLQYRLSENGNYEQPALDNCGVGNRTNLWDQRHSQSVGSFRWDISGAVSPWRTPDDPAPAASLEKSGAGGGYRV